MPACADILENIRGSEKTNPLRNMSRAHLIPLFMLQVRHRWKKKVSLFSWGQAAIAGCRAQNLLSEQFFLGFFLWLGYQVPLPMASGSTDAAFIVWGIDQTAYGPVELPTLLSWVQDERITAETWIFAARDCSWQQAADLPELQMFFHKSATAAKPVIESLHGIEVG